MANTDSLSLRAHLSGGHVIPAMPLALDESGKWSRRYQRALVRYYLEAGSGGLAVGVHSTQFEIRDPEHNLFEPVLSFCSEEIDRARSPGQGFIKIAGVCGNTEQALAEARFSRAAGYDAALLSTSALRDDSDAVILDHCARIAEEIPVIGFYLQPTIGGRSYSFDFWRRFLDIENVIAIKVAPFDRYATLEVVRALAESGRRDVTLYTGNDDNIIHDLLSSFPFPSANAEQEPIRFAGGLLGQWAIGTEKAVRLLRRIQTESLTVEESTRLNTTLTDFNSAIFDPAHAFSGCLSGMNEMLRRDGLLPSRRCLEESEALSPGQSEELDRVREAYPEWQDTTFIRAHLSRWLTE